LAREARRPDGRLAREHVPGVAGDGFTGRAEDLDLVVLAGLVKFVIVPYTSVQAFDRLENVAVIDSSSGWRTRRRTGSARDCQRNCREERPGPPDRERSCPPYRRRVPSL
jgi:hypothetical protein